MTVEEVEMKSRRSLVQNVIAGEVLLALFVLAKWEEEKLLVVCVQVMWEWEMTGDVIGEGWMRRLRSCGGVLESL